MPWEQPQKRQKDKMKRTNKKTLSESLEWGECLLCAAEISGGWGTLDVFRMRAGHQKEQSLIRELEIPAPPPDHQGEESLDWANHQWPWIQSCLHHETASKSLMDKVWSTPGLLSTSRCPERAHPFPHALPYASLPCGGSSAVPFNKPLTASKALSHHLWALPANYQTSGRGSWVPPVYSWLVSSTGDDLGLVTGLRSGDGLVGLSPYRERVY